MTMNGLIGPHRSSSKNIHSVRQFAHQLRVFGVAHATFRDNEDLGQKVLDPWYVANCGHVCVMHACVLSCDVSARLSVRG